MMAARYEDMSRGHAEALAPMVQEVMAEANSPMSTVDQVAVTTGPGTFTGCRIGLAFGRTLGAALGRPVLGVPTLQSIAANVYLSDAKIPGKDIAALMDARRGEVYLQLFSSDGTPRNEAQVIPVEAAVGTLSGSKLVLAGTGADVLISATPDEVMNWIRAGVPDFPDARHVGAIARCLAESNVMPEPLYLRAPDAKLPQNKPQLRAI